MNIWQKRRKDADGRQRNEIKQSGDWQTITNVKKQNKPSSSDGLDGLDTYPTLESSQYSKFPVNKTHFFHQYKTVAYNIGTDIFNKKQITNYEDYLRTMVDFLVVERDEHINQLRLKHSHAENHGFLQIPQDKYVEERKYMVEWADGLVREMQQASRSGGEDASTNVSHAQNKSTLRQTEPRSELSQNIVKSQAIEVEKMAHEDTLEELGFSIPFIREFYSVFPKKQKQSLHTVARAMFDYEDEYANQDSQESFSALQSGLHNDMQYARAYAAPAGYTDGHSMAYAAPVGYADGHSMAYGAAGCHPMAYAAPVASAGPHAMPYAAMAYDPAHAMTYAAPVGCADGHPLTCAAPTCHGGACAAQPGDNSFRHSKFDYRIEFRDDRVCLLHEKTGQVYCGRGRIQLLIEVSRGKVTIDIAYPSEDTSVSNKNLHTDKETVSWYFLIKFAKWYIKLNPKQQQLFDLCRFSCDVQIQNKDVKSLFDSCVRRTTALERLGGRLSEI